MKEVKIFTPGGDKGDIITIFRYLKGWHTNLGLGLSWSCCGD